MVDYFTRKLTWDETQFLHQALHNSMALRGSLDVGVLRPSRLLSIVQTHMQTAELFMAEELRQFGEETKPADEPDEPSVAADAADPRT